MMIKFTAWLDELTIWYVYVGGLTLQISVLIYPVQQMSVYIAEVLVILFQGNIS